MTGFGIVAWTTFRVFARRPVTWLVLAIPVLTTVMAAMRGSLHPFGEAHIFGMLAPMFLTIGIVGDEIDSGHLQLLLLKPLTRAGYLLGKIAGAVLMESVALLLATVLAAAVTREASPASVVLGGALELLAMTGWIAALTAISVITPRFWNVPAFVIAAVAWITAEIFVRQSMGPGPAARLQAVGEYLLPPRFGLLVTDVAEHGVVAWSELAFGVFYVLAAALAGALLLRRRQLASRRA